MCDAYISRTELKCATVTVEKRARPIECTKRAGWTSDATYLLLRKKARSVQFIKRAEWSSDTQY